MAVYTVPYRPRNWARRMHASWARWFVTVLHRRAGKTTSWINHHQRAATDDAWERERLLRLNPKFTESELKELLRERIYAHVLPSLTQAKTVAWDKLKLIASVVPGIKKNESELSIRYPAKEGSTRMIRLFGADNIDALRGFPLSGLSLDEFSQHPPGIFGEVLSKSLADHLGYCAFLGTIKGKNQLYQAYMKAKDDPTWFTLWQDINVSIKTEDGGTIRALELAMQDDEDLIRKELMTQEEFDQEWFLNPHAAIKGAYYSRQLAKAIKDGRIGKVPYDPALPVFDVWDLGVGPNISVGMFQRTGKAIAMIDYHQGSGDDGIPQVIAELKTRDYVWGKHFAPHDIVAKEIGSGQTRAKTAEDLGWKFEAVNKLPLDDGIQIGRNLFNRLWIDETKCEDFVEAIGQYRRTWNERLGMFGDKPEHDFSSHPADMWRYAAIAEPEMVVEAHRPVRIRQRPRGQRPKFTPRTGRQGKLGYMR